MVMDKNPSFGVDKNQEANARKVANMLWQVSGGNFSQIPADYLNNLGFEYSDGTVSMLDQLSKVEFSEDTSFEEFSEVVEHLVRVNPEEWPYSESILSIQPEKLLYEIEPEPFEFSEFDWDFAAPGDMSDKVELFLKKVISSVYLDGVTSVTDSKGNPPNEQNNFLMAPDGKKFSGVFYDKGGEKEKQFPFEIRENKKGNFEIVY